MPLLKFVGIFYKTVVQAVLLLESEGWNITLALLIQLEEFYF